MEIDIFGGFGITGRARMKERKGREKGMAEKERLSLTMQNYLVSTNEKCVFIFIECILL